MTNERKEKLQSLTEQLQKGVKDVFESGRYAEYLQKIASFHQYSFGNTILIALQCPQASRVASYKKWQELGRQVRKGEKGIKILVPIFRKKRTSTEDAEAEEEQEVFCSCTIGNVFDISQTDGTSIELAESLNANVTDYSEIIRKLKAAAPLPVIQQDIVLNKYNVRGACYFGSHISIKTGMSEADELKTLIHEMAHATLHGSEDGKTRNVREIEAESVAFIVSAYLGIDTSKYSFGYVASWGRSQTYEELRKSLTSIQKAANQIITAYTAAE